METRLFNLTEEMIRSSAKTSPKLKTRAGETRALVPWAWEIAQTMLDQLDPFEQAIFFAIKYLHQAYQCLSKKNFQHQHFHDVCFNSFYNTKPWNFWLQNTLGTSNPSSMEWLSLL